MPLFDPSSLVISMRLLIVAVLIGVGGLIAGFISGLLLLRSLALCDPLLPDECILGRVILDLYNYSPLIIALYVLVVILASIVMKKKALLVLLALTPGIYMAITLPTHIALWLIS